jgi:hypothetical protein
MAQVATKPGHDLSCTRLWSGFLLGDGDASRKGERIVRL